MNFVLKPNTVLSVVRGHDPQQWHVTAQDMANPLASFNDPQAACAWAIARARSVQGRVLVEEMTTPSPPQFDANAGFKYSIPVMLCDECGGQGTTARVPDRKPMASSPRSNTRENERPT